MENGRMAVRGEGRAALATPSPGGSRRQGPVPKPLRTLYRGSGHRHCEAKPKQSIASRCPLPLARPGQGPGVAIAGSRLNGASALPHFAEQPVEKVRRNADELPLETLVAEQAYLFPTRFGPGRKAEEKRGE